jgi:hypothetical protein
VCEENGMENKWFPVPGQLRPVLREPANGGKQRGGWVEVGICSFALLLRVVSRRGFFARSLRVELAELLP